MKILSGLKDQTEAVFDLMKNVTCLDISENSVQYLHGLGTITQLQHLYMNNLDSPGSVIASSLSCLDTSHLVTWQARNISMQSSDLARILSQRNFCKLTWLDLSHGGDSVVTDQV